MNRKITTRVVILKAHTRPRSQQSVTARFDPQNFDIRGGLPPARLP
jgi:hypothetical protein